MALSLGKKMKTVSGAPKPPGRGPSSSGASSKAGKKSFILLVGDEGSILIFMQGSKVVRRLFAPSAKPTHSEAMVELMQANPSVPLTLLVDVIDQQYVPQTFPPVSALSVGALVKRRLSRDFQPDDLTGSLQIGRDKAGRKEWKYLLISLAKTPLMGEWLDLLLDLPNEMKGIYLVPIEAEQYIAMLNKKLSNNAPRPWQLLISHNKVSGFRQVVAQNGKLIFTRVSQAIDDAIPAVIAGNIEQEIINTMEYLKRLEFRDTNELEATVIISQDVIESLDLSRFNFGRVTIMSPLTVAETLGLEQAALSADRFGDVVLAAAFGVRKKHALRFSNAYIDKLSKIYKARLGLVAVSALLVIACLGLAGTSVLSALSDSKSISQAQTKEAALQPDLNKLKGAVGGINKDVAFKSAVASTYDAYVLVLPALEDSLAKIATFASPQHRIVTMTWDAAGTDKAGQAAASPTVAAGSPVLEIALEIDFSGSGNTVETLDSAANGLRTTMQASLPEFDVTTKEFPWQKEQNNPGTISLDKTTSPDQTSGVGANVTNAVVEFRLSGLKKVAATPSAGGSSVPPASAVMGEVAR